MPNALGEEYSVAYSLTGPDGTEAVFNDPDDPNYAGRLSQISGILSSEVRENAFDRPQGDGGVHGNFYFGRKPVIMDVEVIASTVAGRNAMLDRIRLASRALRADATLRWTPTDGEQLEMGLRLQQPPRSSGGWMKEVQLQMVSANPWAESTTDYTAADTGTDPEVTLTYGGDIAGPLTLTVLGPATNPVITNDETGESIGFTKVVAATKELVVTMTPGVASVSYDGAVDESLLDYDNSVFWALVNGSNTISFAATATSGATTLTVDWNNAYG